MKTKLLRKHCKDFIQKEVLITQNELARRSGIPASTFSKIMTGKFTDISLDPETKLLLIVKPELSDIDVIAGKIKQIVVRKYPASVAHAVIIRLAENLQKV